MGGDFKNGELNYWPSDDKKLPLEDFDHKEKITVDIRDNLLLFDGNRGHYVNPFQGERYSLVFFSIRTWNKVPKEEAAEAIRCGIPLPTKKSMDYATSLLGPKGPAGYRIWPGEVSKGAGNTPNKKRKATSPSTTPAKESGRKMAAENKN